MNITNISGFSLSDIKCKFITYLQSSSDPAPALVARFHRLRHLCSEPFSRLWQPTRNPADLRRFRRTDISSANRAGDALFMAESRTSIVAQPADLTPKRLAQNPASLQLSTPSICSTVRRIWCQLAGAFFPPPS